VHVNAPGAFLFCKPRRRSRFILEIDIRERLSAVVAHDKTSSAFFDGPPGRVAP
jgi:hypothetical protein